MEKDDRLRRRVYGGLLIFVVFAGILLVGIPQFRIRLVNRARLLKGAATGETRPDILPMGSAGAAEDKIPYPEEFLRPAAPKVQTGPRAAVLRPSPEPAEPFDFTRRNLTAAPSAGASANTMEPDMDEDTDQTPRFQQGTKGKEVYEKTLAANAPLAGMVNGGNPGLRFKTWGAARRGNGLYWVRVVFADVSGTDVEYIWQVDASGKVTPLNFNARSL